MSINRTKLPEHPSLLSVPVEVGGVFTAASLQENLTASNMTEQHQNHWSDHG